MKLGELGEIVGETGLRSREIDALKGVFIALIVIGHNPILSQVVEGMHAWLYSFHIHAFFILPFLFTPKKLTKASLSGLLVRYIYPFLSWVTLAALLYSALYAQGVNLGEQTLNFLYGVIWGTAPSLELACGLQLYWFLPALLSLNLVRSKLLGFPDQAGRFWLALCIIVLCFVGLASSQLDRWQFCSFLSVMAVWPICVFSINIHKKSVGVSAYKMTLLWGGAFVVLSIMAFKYGWGINLATLRLFSFNQPLPALYQFFMPVVAFNLVASFVRWRCVAYLFHGLGKHSLLIYLTHTLIFYSIETFLLSIGLSFSDSWWGWGSMLMTLVFASLFSVTVNRNEFLRCLVVPRSLIDLSSVWKRVCFVRR